MAIRRNLTTFGVLGAALLLLARLAGAQQPTVPAGVGVVTALQGQATVSRQTLPGGSALHFKDDVFFQDQIATKERSTVRLLLGGKGVLTVREQSQVTLDETVAPDGARRSVLSVLAGKIGAAIAHSLMRPGDEVEIRTPNAVAAIRGTTLIVEYVPSQTNTEAAKPVLLASSAPPPSLAQAAGAPGGHSTFLVLTGSVIVTPQGQPPVTLGSMQSVSITATPGGVKAGTVQNVTQAQAAQAAQGLQTGRPHTGEAAGDMNTESQGKIAAAVANAIVQSVTGGQQQAAAPVPATAPPPSNTIAPIVPTVLQQQAAAPVPQTTPPSGGASTPPVPPVVQTGVAPGPLLSLTNLNVGVDAGTPLITFSAGTPNTVTPVAVSAAVITSPLIQATGPAIAHSGPIATLAGSSIVGDQASIGASLVTIGGVPVTNTGGPVFSLGGGSAVSTSGSLLDVGTGGSAELAGLVEITGASTLALGRADGLAVVAGSLTATDALFKVESGSSIATLGEGALAYTDPGTLTLHAPILSATDSIIALTGPVLTATESTVTGDSLGRLVALQNSIFGLSRGAVLESEGSTLSFAGPLVSDAGSTFALGGHFLRVRDGSTLTATTTLPLMQFSGSTVAMDGNIFHMSSDPGQPGSSLSLAGPLLAATNTLFDDGPLSNFVSVKDGSVFTSSTADPLITLNGGSITTQGHVARFGLDSSSTNNPTGSQDAVSVRLAGPLLRGTDTDIRATFSLVNIRDRATFESTTTAPLIQLGGSTLSVGGIDPDPASPTFEQQANGRVFDVSPVLTTPFPASAILSGPVLRATNTSITTTERILGVFGVAGAGATLTSHTAEPSVQLTGGSVTMSGVFTPSTAPAGTTTDTSGSFLRMFSPDPDAPAILSLAGPLLAATGTIFDGRNQFLRVDQNAQLTDTGIGPLVQLSGTTVSINGTETFEPAPGSPGSPTTTTFGNFVRVDRSGAVLTLAGPLLVDSSSRFTLGGHFLQVRDGATLNATSTLPLMQFTDSTVRMNGALFNLGSGPGQPGSTATLTGPLLGATNSTFDSGPLSNFVTIHGGATFTGTTTGPLLTVSGGSITTKGHVVRIGLNSPDSQAPVSARLAGPLLLGTDTDISTIGSVLTIRDRGTFSSTTTAPLIQLGGTAGSTLVLGGPDPDPASPTFRQQLPGQVFGVQPLLTTRFSASAGLAGPVLSATNTAISTTDRILGIIGATGAGATLTSNTADPLVQLTGGSLTMSGTSAPTPSIGGTTTLSKGSFVRMSSPDPTFVASLSVAGPLLDANGTTISGQNHFLNIGDNAQLTSSGTTPAIQLTNSPVTVAGTSTFTPTGGTPSTSAFGNFLILTTNASMVLGGSPLLSAADSPLSVARSLMHVFGGGRLTSATTDSLIRLSGGVHDIGSANLIGSGSLLDLGGVTIDPATGLGTDPVLRTGGPIIELSGATPATGATVNLAGAGNAIRVDTALLQASAPIVNLINSTLNTSTTGDPTNGAMHIFQSSVTSNGPVIGLNHSILQVNNGPVLSLTGGSQMTVNGDLATLINGSKVAVLNGPLISVDGGPTATKSTLTINGALVNFAAGTGNQVLINNSIPATRVDTTSNVPIPVRETGPGSLVSITNPTVVKNPANGSLSLTCTAGCVGPNPASVIQVLGGGRVFIKP